MNTPFLKHLNVRRQANVIVTAEDEDFDQCTLDRLQAEGFQVQYVAMGRCNAREFADRLHTTANEMTGVSDAYAIIAYGDAAATVMESYLNGAPRLCALIAYYPSTIPDPSRTRYPTNMSVLVHLAGQQIGVRRRQEILGIQGKPRTVQKRIDHGIGLGGELRLSFPSFKYEGVEQGFAEADLEDHDEKAEDLAWGRTIRTLRAAFGLHVDLEMLRDRHSIDVETSLDRALERTSARARVIYGPTNIGAATPADLQRFYSEFFKPAPCDLNALLISRTTDATRVVDEIALSFKHDREIPWMLPGVPATHKQVKIVIVSIVCIQGGLFVHEHVYWDQASVLLQIGLLDLHHIPEAFLGKGLDRLPVVGAESFDVITGVNNSLKLPRVW